MKLQKDGRTLAKEDIYLDLSKLSEEERNQVRRITEYNVDDWNFVKYLINDHTGWNQVGETWLKNRREISYPDFVKLFQKELTELPEKWYIRGGVELEAYFKGAVWDLYGGNGERGYFKYGDKWLWDNISELTDHTEITVADYKRLSGSAENAHTENPVSSKMETTETCAENSDKEDYDPTKLYDGESICDFSDYILISELNRRKFFVFPKAPEGDFPDLSNYRGFKMNSLLEGKMDFRKRNIKCKIDSQTFIAKYGNVIVDVRPIQKPTPTVQELWKIAEEAGADLSRFEKPTKNK